MFELLTILIRLAELDRQPQEAAGSGSLKGCATERDRLALQLPEAVQQQYERLRQHRGTALAQVVQGSCSGCRMLVRMAVREKLKQEREVVTCEFCGRILYRSAQGSHQALPLPPLPHKPL